MMFLFEHTSNIEVVLLLGLVVRWLGRDKKGLTGKSAWALERECYDGDRLNKVLELVREGGDDEGEGA